MYRCYDPAAVDERSQARIPSLSPVIDAAPSIGRYFEALEDSRFGDASQCFTDDAFYSHTPYGDEPPGSPRHEVRGRAEILRLFEERGPRATQHRIEVCALSANHGFISGTAWTGLSAEASFIGEFVLSDDGRIAWYASYVSNPRVGAVLT
jgi:hypothetical protein